jgi:hypothetical protein
MSIRNSAFASTDVQHWGESYKAALLEKDQQKLPARVAHAQRALILRARELFSMSGDNSEEGQGVDDTLYALQALRSCMELKTSEPNAA